MTATLEAPTPIGEVPTFEVCLKIRRYLPPETDDVVLRLEFDDGTYLIADELS